MRDTMLKNLARWHADHPWRMLIIVFVLSLIFMGFGLRSYFYFKCFFYNVFFQMYFFKVFIINVF